MGDYEEAPRSSSGVAAFIRGLIAAALTFGIYWLVVGGAPDGAPVALDTPTVEPAPAATTTPPVTTTPALTTPPTTQTTTPDTGAIGQGLSIQVLDGAGDPEAAREAIAVLRDLGYEVVAEDPPVQARQAYSQTTVFATAGFEADAESLVQADPRFTTVEENPGTLDEAIDLHVVVGADWPSGDEATPTPTAT